MPPETCTSGSSLNWNCNQSAVKVYRVKGKQTSPDYFDLSTWNSGSEGQWQYWNAQNGILNKRDIETGIDDNPLNHFQVFPNPTLGNLNITIGSIERAEISLLDMNGKTLLTFNLGENYNGTYLFNIEHLASGIYILQMHRKDYVKLVKVIKL